MADDLGTDADPQPAPGSDAAGGATSPPPAAPTAENVGALLRSVRKALGLTRQQVADATAEAPRGKAVRPGALGRIEQGEKKPSARALAALMYALGVDDADVAAAADRLFTATGGQSVRKQIQELGMASSGIGASGALGLAPGVGVADSAAAILTLRQQNEDFRTQVARALRARLAAIDADPEAGSGS